MKRLEKAILLFLLFPTLSTTTALSQAGESGLAFLKLGISGRGIGMGDAMSAIVTGAAATYYNPAGILATPENSTSQLMFMHKEWIQDTRVEFLGSSIPLDDRNAVGFSLNSTTVSDIEIRTRPGSPEGTFTARNLSFGASYARLVGDDLRLGISGKFLYQKILVDQSSGYGIDLGAQYTTSLEGLSLGAVVANVGRMQGLRGGTTTLPSLLRIGPAYRFQVEGINSKISLASDYLYIFPEAKSYVNAGGELVFNETIAARAGYQFGSEGRGLAAGLGIIYGIIMVDYAYSHLTDDLGNTHTVSLALNF